MTDRVGACLELLTIINDPIAAWCGNGWDDPSPTTVRHYQDF
ncbi:hypothetical protein FEAC_17700 [Ferrimicrobium acidiphilum DSM 19497]|uniref:Uncharacterized protein n=1 Tax=Ferrimicrobium acidiphilum DSM 19497 TaxID=1121877 RepID=A0A0D8FTD6_9ACTN|nr:hypothetical protein FEAC_17700 [Ferrimicrobium acidiphilum DSM 19497]